MQREIKIIQTWNLKLKNRNKITIFREENNNKSLKEKNKNQVKIKVINGNVKSVIIKIKWTLKIYYHITVNCVEKEMKISLF